MDQRWEVMLKRAAGLLLWKLGQRSFALRRRLVSFGLRTRPEWYAGRVAEVELFGGHTAHLADFDKNYLSFQLFWRGWRFYEPFTTAVASELLKEMDGFVDIGANIGYYSLTAAVSFPRLRVLAFEPNPKLIGILRRNVERNRLSIEVEATAVSDQIGPQRFFLPSSDMSGSLEESFNPDISKVIEVAAAPLDVIAEEKQLDGSLLVKVDTEGHESAVLRGARRLIREQKPDMILEVTGEYDTDSTNLLRENGYRFYPITAHGLDPQDELRVCRDGDLLYLNTLVSTKEPEEIHAVFDRVQDQLRGIDLQATSLYSPARQK